MSLTVALDDPNSAISRFFERWLPHDESLTKGWARTLRQRWRYRPSPDLRLAHLTGPAIELRIGYDLAPTLPYNDLAAVLEPSAAQGRARSFGYAPPTGKQDAPLEAWQNTREWVTSVHQGNVDQQVELLHHCWRLAYVDDLRRVLTRHGWDERALPGVWDRANNLAIGDESTNALLGTWQTYIKYGRKQMQTRGSHAVVRPTFIPGFAVGDLVIGTTVIDVKFTHDPEETLGYCLKQVLAYALSDGGKPSASTPSVCTTHGKLTSKPGP